MQDFYINYRNQIKEQYGFKEWMGKVSASDGPVCSGFLPDHKVLSGYIFEERRAFPGQKFYFTDYFRLEKDDMIRFAVTIRVLPTIEEAHERMIDFLSYCMAPDMPVAEKKGITAGDIAFTGHDDEQSAVFFTRNNVLIHVESIGSKQASVKELAQLFDSQIVAFQKHNY